MILAILIIPPPATTNGFAWFLEEFGRFLFTQMDLGTNSLCFYSNIWVQWCFLLGGWDSGGEDRRRVERSQHFSQPVTTKTTKSKLVTLFTATLFLRYSSLPSFLFIYSPLRAFFPFPLQIGIKCGERDCEEVEMWSTQFDARKQGWCFTSSPLLKASHYSVFWHSGCKPWASSSFLQINHVCVHDYKCVFTHKHASVLYVVQDVHCLTLTSHFLWQDKRHAGREETVSDRLNTHILHEISARREKKKHTHSLSEVITSAECTVCVLTLTCCGAAPMWPHNANSLTTEVFGW